MARQARAVRVVGESGICHDSWGAAARRRRRDFLVEPAETDRELERLGPVRAELPQLVERYCGASRLTLAAADAQLAELEAALPPEQVARVAELAQLSGASAPASWSSDAELAVSNGFAQPRAAAGGGSYVASSYPPPPTAAGSIRPHPSEAFVSRPSFGRSGLASGAPLSAAGFTETDASYAAGGSGIPRSDPPHESPSAKLTGAVSAWSRSWSSAPAPEHPAASRPPSVPANFAESARSSYAPGSRPPASRPAAASSRPPLSAAESAPPIFELPEPKDGPLTQRMSAREVRTPVPRRPFAGGLAGADDLPQFPINRPPQTARSIPPPLPPRSAAAASPAPTEQDNFEIIVDDEILEIEPDDPLLEEVER
jgi:hypothetical protein